MTILEDFISTSEEIRWRHATTAADQYNISSRTTPVSDTDTYIVGQA